MKQFRLAAWKAQEIYTFIIFLSFYNINFFVIYCYLKTLLFKNSLQCSAGLRLEPFFSLHFGWILSLYLRKLYIFTLSLGGKDVIRHRVIDKPDLDLFTRISVTCCLSNMEPTLLCVPENLLFSVCLSAAESILASLSSALTQRYADTTHIYSPSSWANINMNLQSSVMRAVGRTTAWTHTHTYTVESTTFKNCGNMQCCVDLRFVKLGIK